MFRSREVFPHDDSAYLVIDITRSTVSENNFSPFFSSVTVEKVYAFMRKWRLMSFYAWVSSVNWKLNC